MKPRVLWKSRYLVFAVSDLVAILLPLGSPRPTLSDDEHYRIARAYEYNVQDIDRLTGTRWADINGVHDMTKLTPEELIRMKQRRDGMTHKRKKKLEGGDGSSRVKKTTDSAADSQRLSGDSDNTPLSKRQKNKEKDNLTPGEDVVFDLTHDSDANKAGSGEQAMDASRSQSQTPIDYERVDRMTRDRRIVAGGGGDFEIFARVARVGPPWYTSDVLMKQFLDFSHAYLKNLEGMRAVFARAMRTIADERSTHVSLAHSLGSAKNERDEAIETLGVMKGKFCEAEKMIEQLKGEKVASLEELQSEKIFRDKLAAQLAGKEQELQSVHEAFELAKSTGKGLDLYNLMNSDAGRPVFDDMGRLAASKIKKLIVEKFPDLDLSFLPADSVDDDGSESGDEDDVGSKLHTEEIGSRDNIENVVPKGPTEDVGSKNDAV